MLAKQTFLLSFFQYSLLQVKKCLIIHNLDFNPIVVYGRLLVKWNLPLTLFLKLNMFCEMELSFFTLFSGKIQKVGAITFLTLYQKSTL